MIRGVRSFAKDTAGSSTIQFVVMFLGFIAVFAFVIQTAIYLYMVASMQKAAEAGVRMAVISAPMAGGNAMLQKIEKSAGHEYGERCRTPLSSGASATGDPCVRFVTPFKCGPDDGACSGPFNSVLNEMRGYNGGITADNVTITYSDVGIGFAGGPRRPMVTVKVSGVNFSGGLFGLLLSFADNAPSDEDLSNIILPSAIASMPAESLGR
jgi:hypothetical protein